MRTQRFTFLCTISEREALEQLASLWRRTKSDTVRLLIADALSRLFIESEANDTGKQGPLGKPQFISTHSCREGGKP